jgi:hypothetical protein
MTPEHRIRISSTQFQTSIPMMSNIQKASRLWSLLALLGLATLAGCNDPKETPPPTGGPTGELIVLEGVITEDYTMTANNKYLLKGYVRFRAPAKLTIEPGTIIFGDKETEGTLVIERGAQIFAEGTVQRPIVFTSELPPGERAPGDWGGIIICGNAPINPPSGTFEVEGGTGAIFGGTNPDDNSGIMRYVRIEFAGIPLFSDQEINGLTMAGVGRGTQIDHIQVSYCSDDAFEWFGGNVDVKHLVAFRAVDDDFDYDLGYQGRQQFLLGVRDPRRADPSVSCGIESDNDASGTASQPFTRPIVSNATFVGPLSDTTVSFNTYHFFGFMCRSRSQLGFYNSIITGWPAGISIQSTVTQNWIDQDLLQARNNIVVGYTKNEYAHAFPVNQGRLQKVIDWFDRTDFENDAQVNNSYAQLTDPFNLSRPNAMPLAGSPALAGAKFEHAWVNDPFFDKVNYRGAFGTIDWTAGWCNWTPQDTEY